MLSRRPLAVLPFVALFACNGNNASDQTGVVDLDRNVDQRIDGAKDLDDAAEAEDELVQSDNVKMCATADGTVYVSWIDARDGLDRVWLNRSTDQGESWLDSPLAVKQGPGNADNMDMACAADRLFFVWEDDRDGETQYENIYLNYTTDGGDTFQSDDIPLDNDPDGLAISLGPQIEVFQGNVHVVWYDQVLGASEIFMATSRNGGRNFDEPFRISGERNDEDINAGGDYYSGSPHMAIDRELGTVHVVWQDSRNGKLDVFHSASRNAGQGFGPQRRIDRGDDGGVSYSYSPQVAADNGHVHVVWHDDRFSSAGRRDVLLNYSADQGDTWFDDAVRVEDDAPGFFESLSPKVVCDEDVAHVVWEDNTFQGFDIFYQQFVAGEKVLSDDPKAAGGNVRMDIGTDPGSSNSVNPVVLLDDDRIVVSWQDRRDDPGEDYNELFYNYYDPANIGEEEGQTASGWLEDQDLRQDAVLAGSSFALEQQIAVVDDMLLTAWVDGRTGSQDIYFSSTLLGESVEFFTFEEAEELDAATE